MSAVWFSARPSIRLKGGKYLRKLHNNFVVASFPLAHTHTHGGLTACRVSIVVCCSVLSTPPLSPKRGGPFMHKVMPDLQDDEGKHGSVTLLKKTLFK